MITDAATVLRAEVQADPAGRPNLVPNPDGDLGAWFWVTPLRFTSISSTGPALRLSTFAGVGDAYTQTNPIRVDAGSFISARLDTVGGSTDHRIKMRFRFFNADGELIATSAPSGTFDTTPATRYYAATEAPAGTKFAKLKIDLYKNAGDPPDEDAYYDFNQVMVTTDEVTFSTPYDYAEPAEFLDILGPTSTITITREAMTPGMIGLRVLDTSLDPAVAETLRTGREFRIRALNDDTEEFEDLAGRYWIIRALVDYDLSKPAEKQATITLTLADSLQLLANPIRQVSVGTIDELSFVVETCAIPFNVNGYTGTLTDDPVVTARLDQATALDQILLTRDREMGYAWVNKAGIFNAHSDRGLDFYDGPVTLDEADYSDLDVTFDTDECINEVLVVRVFIDSAGQTREITYGPYRDESAIDEWKVVRRATFRVTGLDESEVEDYATQVLTANSVPERRVNSVTVPIRTAADITPAKALIDLYATAHITNTAKGIDVYQRVTSITHTIRATTGGVRWVMELGFSTPDTVSSPGPLAGASGGAGLTIQPDDSVYFENTDTGTASGPGDLELDLTHTPISKSLHVYWNGLHQAPTEWTLTGTRLTLSDPDDLLQAGDVIAAAYAYNDVSAPSAVPLTFLGATADIDAWTFPSEATDGGLLIAVAMVVDTKTPTLNGWTNLGQTDLVTHAASSGTYTYRLIALATTYEAGVTALPTIPSFGLDSVCLMAAFDATGNPAVLFDTEADDTAGNTPPISPSSIRVWGTIGNSVTPVPSGGTQIAYEPGSDICLLMTLDDSTGPVAATTGTASGWCLASIGVTA